MEKLVVAIVQRRDAGRAIAEMNRRGLTATKLASTGGFLRAGNTTILVGVQAADVEIVVAILRRTCALRQEVIASTASTPGVEAVPFPVEVSIGGATVFVMDVQRYEKF